MAGWAGAAGYKKRQFLASYPQPLHFFAPKTISAVLWSYPKNLDIRSSCSQVIRKQTDIHTNRIIVLFVHSRYVVYISPVFCRGSVIAKIIGNNVQGKPDAFVEQVLMYVYEEMVDDMKLTDIINTKHENVKYLPGCMLPDNVVSILLSLYSSNKKLFHVKFVTVAYFSI